MKKNDRSRNTRRINKRLPVALAALFLLISLAACASTQSKSKTVETTAAAMSQDMFESADAANRISDQKSGSILPGESSSMYPNGDQKLIKTANMSVETKKFDEFNRYLSSKVSSLNGYISESSVSGTSSRSESSPRSARFVLRVPSAQLQEITDEIKTMANVISYDENISDVTLEYVDTESRIKSLRTEQETLLSMLEKAENLADVMAIQGRLTEVRYSIESYEAQLRSLKNRVDYSTVSVYVSEVKDFTSAEESSFFDEALRRLSEGLKSFGRAMRALALFVIGNLPLLLFIALIVVLVLLIIKRSHKKQALKRHQAVPRMPGMSGMPGMPQHPYSPPYPGQAEVQLPKPPQGAGEREESEIEGRLQD